MRLQQGTIWLPEYDLRIETYWSDFKCFNVKFYVSALVGIIKVKQLLFERKVHTVFRLIRCGYLFAPF